MASTKSFNLFGTNAASVFFAFWPFQSLCIRSKSSTPVAFLAKTFGRYDDINLISGAALLRGSILASHTADPGSILGVPENFFQFCWDLWMALVRGKWAEARKYRSNPYSALLTYSSCNGLYLDAYGITVISCWQMPVIFLVYSMGQWKWLKNLLERRSACLSNPSSTNFLTKVWAELKIETISRFQKEKWECLCLCVLVSVWVWVFLGVRECVRVGGCKSASSCLCWCVCGCVFMWVYVCVDARVCVCCKSLWDFKSGWICNA